jgi:hypothetical protein
VYNRICVYIIVLLGIPLMLSHAQTWEKSNLSGYYFSVIEKTPYGILAGEMDTRYRPEIYNGVLLSTDFGHSWSKLGLEGRGITCIGISNNLAVFGTYFNENNSSGLFLFNFETKAWQNLNFPYQVTAAYINENYILAGTLSRGIWKSDNYGVTWVQQTEASSPFPKINVIKENDFKLFAGTLNGLLVSSDNGENWTYLTEFNNKHVKHIATNKDTIAVGTFTNDGIYVSKDNANTWNKSVTFGNKSVGGLEIFKNCLYAGKSEPIGYGVYKSCDYGNNWQSIGNVTSDISTRINDLEPVFSTPDLLLVSVNGEGISKTNLHKEYSKNPIFSRPWESKSYPLIDFITSYLDHEYPLLGTRFIEPPETQTTTYNFLGKKESEPNLFYSSHNGTDFKLPYGTNILSVDDGIARYSFCTDCGHTIVVDHTNGYQTQYMHLQAEGLITTQEQIPVTKGQIIGKVGTTGRTTGPHLHFMTTKDRDNNNTFADDFPWGISDPFGWQCDLTNDPWTQYSIQGQSGIESVYLWDEDQENASVRIIGNLITTASVSNLQINIPQNATRYNSTLNIYNYIRPKMPQGFYIPGTSYIVELTDILGSEITLLNSPIELTYTLKDSIPSYIKENSLAIYYYDNLHKAWVKIESVLDLDLLTLKATTTHLTHFAVFGDVDNALMPQTELNIQGTKVNGWYTVQPLITLTSNNSSNLIMYSEGNGEQWHKYVVPFVYKKEGITTLYYKSISPEAQEESIQEVQIRLDTLGMWHTSLRIENSGFNTQLLQ